jgi:hypothetical protein
MARKSDTIEHPMTGGGSPGLLDRGSEEEFEEFSQLASR